MERLTELVFHYIFFLPMIPISVMKEHHGHQTHTESESPVTTVTSTSPSSDQMGRATAATGAREGGLNLHTVFWYYSYSKFFIGSSAASALQLHPSPLTSPLLPHLPTSPTKLPSPPTPS
jgi:hypothetical protein